MLKNIKIISLISLTILAYHPNIKTSDKPGLMRLVVHSQKQTPKNTSPVESSPLLTQEIPESTNQEPISSKYHVTDSEYTLPVVPAQAATGYPPCESFRLSDTLQGRLLRFIHHGCYDLACMKEAQTIAGQNSTACYALTDVLTEELRVQKEKLVNLLRDRRQTVSNSGNNLLLLLMAINKHSDHPKNIDPNCLKTQFERIQEIRKKSEQLTRLFLQEQQALDTYLQNVQKELSDAHLTGKTSLPLSPSKTLEQFTATCLEKK